MWWRKKADHPRDQINRCSFCNKAQDDVKKLIAGPRVFICDDCVEVCNDIIADDNRFEKTRAGNKSAQRADGDPVAWPNSIQCALCRTGIPVNEGIVVAGNRGTLCAGCVDAIDGSRHQTSGR
jgi:hypothetical protein